MTDLDLPALQLRGEDSLFWCFVEFILVSSIGFDKFISVLDWSGSSIMTQH